MPGGVCVLKNVPARRYLTVTLDQWNLLRNFATAGTVPDVLRAVILNRSCLPLREYYELILKAQRVGVLKLERQTEPEARARRWAVPLNAWVPIVLGWVSLIAAVALLATQPFHWPSPLPGGVLDVVIGWALLCAGLSVGSALAASTLVWGGGEIYEPGFAILRPAPYFKVNLEDACMTSLLTQVGVWSAKFLPVMLTAVLLWWYRPAWGLVHVIAVLVMLRPFAGGSITPFLSALFRGHLLDTHKNMLFSPNRRWKVRLKFGLARVSALYVAARIVWGAGWCVLVLMVTLRAAGRSVREVVGSADYWREVGMGFVAVGGLAVLVFVGRPIARSLFVRVRAHYKNFHVLVKRWRTKPEEVSGTETVSQLMADSLVFRRLPPPERAELLKRAKLQSFKAGALIRKFSDKSADVGLILSGAVSISRRLKTGRAERVLMLTEGDVYGAHALLDAGRPEAQIRALTPLTVFVLPIEDFQTRVVARLGVSLANDLIHKAPFLRRLSFCRGWHPQALARFAQISSTVGYHEGETIVAERQDSHQFYVVYEGRVLVKRGRKVISRLGPGGFFGEISLLQNSAAVADVLTKESVRCLTISKSDFLRFMTHNPLVGMQLEEISSARLGRPIFPLNVHSFEVR